MADENPNPSPNPAEARADDGERVVLGRIEFDRLAAASVAGERARYQQERAETERQRTADERLAALESRYRSATLRGGVSDAIGGLEFTSDRARDDALALMAAEVEPREVDGEIVVYHRGTGRPLHEVDRAAIEQRFDHLLKPQAQGGTGRTAEQPMGGSGAPSGSMAERLIQATVAASAAAGQRGPVGGFRRGF